ncbi:MAG TPA: PVC-type heme-binding CxxCH protein, partial [Flavitalea sp.]|nr:PVC-type heme-binding CxxCH protein [Flavitalea sp.]
MLASCSQKQSTPSEFQIEPGFTFELVAREPLIESPVDFEFNEAGDAMVVTMPGYASSDKPSSILILKDNNKDGVYDDKIVFTDKLRLATSILPYKDGVLVTDAPFLLFLRDTDKDYKADAIDTLMGGLLTSALSHRFNGLTYGLDNWIYVANGGNGGKPYWWGDTSAVIDLRGQDFRFNFDKKIIERIGHTSGGFGLGINTWGHLFETHNLNHVSHLVFPQRYMESVKLPMDHSLLNISDHEVNGLSRIYPIGEQVTRVNHPEQSGFFSGSCGVTYYEGGEFGPEYEQTVWVADVVLNLIHVDKIKPKGASFVASRLFEKKEFMASTDRSFRPVNMTIGPDGSLYVVDMHRGVIEEPEWIPDEIEKNLDLNAGKGQGRLYK